MTLSLDSFKKEGDGLELSKFKEAIPAGMKIGSKAASTIAATRSVLTETDEAGFRQTREMLLNPETRGNFAVEQTALRERMFKDATDNLGSLASDPNLPIDERMALVDSANKGFTSPFSSTPNLDMLAEESILADSEGEDDFASESRTSFIDSIREVNGRKRRIASAINGLRLTQDMSTSGMVVDVLERVVPLTEWVHVDRLLQDAESNLGDDSKGTTALLGAQKQRLYDMIEAMPSSDREEFSYAIMDLVQEHGNIIFPDGNDLMTAQTLERMLLDNHYSNFEKWFDNATSVLDAIFVGGVVRGVGKSGQRALSGGRAADTASNARVYEGEIVSGGREVVLRDVRASEEADDVFDLAPSEWTDLGDLQRVARSESTTTDVVPTSASQVVKDTNPTLARNMHEAALADETGEAAEALYGSSRTEAGARDLLPSNSIGGTSAPNKVEMPRRPQFDEPANIRQMRLAEGNTAVNRTEMSRVVNSMADKLRLQVNNLVVKSNDSGTFGITARYNPVDSGFRSYDDAVENAKYAFRNYGLEESNFTVMFRQGDQWKSVTRETAGNIPANTPYSVALDFEYRFRPEDLEEVDLLTTGNFLSRTLDRMPATPLSPSALGQGSITQNLLDAASVVHPQIVNAASVAVDKTVGLRKMYVDLIGDFTQGYSAASKERRLLMSDYINKANFDGIKFDVTDLRSRGFTGKEIEALKSWRRANDAMWHATNADMVKTLRGRGYQTFVHPASDTKLIGRPVSRGSVKPRELGFDASKNTNANLNAAYLDDLYENGGSIIRLDEPMEIDGQWVQYAVSRDTVEGGYLRALRDGEVVLNYRDGYYPVMYDANYFVRKQIKNPDGTTFNKVVGSTKTRQEADEAIARMVADDPEAVLSYKKDRRFGELRTTEIGEEGWQTAVNSGLSSQRVRGQKLADLSGEMHAASNANLKDPLEAVTSQIASLSQRVPMRQYFDTVKKRWLLNYGDELDLPVNSVTGKVDFPTSITQIKGRSGVKSSFVADARSNFNYIYSLENGYINAIDNGYKAVMHGFADLAADLKLPAVEKAMLNSTAISPVQGAKSAAFNMFLSLNPVRQAIIQRGQILTLGAVNPRYVGKGLLRDLYNINLQRAGYHVSDDVASLLKEIDEAGILQAVDAHNFVRQDMTRLADLTAMQRAGTLAMRPIEALRKVGFDLAEQDNLLSAWLAHRDLAARAGKNLNSQRVKEEILGDTRAYTLNMNRAGDMPYAQNTLGLAAQFLSFPHKALLQGVTNKSLSGLERAKILAYSTAMFGVSATALAPAVHWAMSDMEPGEMKDTIEDGMLHKLLNTVATLATGEKQAIDWGDLAPTEAYGMGEVLVGMYNTDLAEMVSASPSGSLLFGANPRVNNLWSTAMRYFSIHDDYEDPELETTLPDVGRAFLNLASGYSNFFKARYALEMRQKMSSSGTINDEDVTAFEAAMAAAGFQTETEVGYRAVREVIYGDSDFTSDDVRMWYQDLKAQIARRGQSVAESDMTRRIFSEAWRVFGSDRPKAAQEITNMLQRDARDGDYKLLQSILREIGYRTEEETREIVNALPEGIVRDRVLAVMETREEEE